MSKEADTADVSAQTIYPFRTMNIGEEFFVSLVDVGPSFRSYVYHRAKALERRFTVRKETRRGVDGLVVERIRL